MNDNVPKEGEVQVMDGRQRRYTSGYWIRYYEPHLRDNLRTALRLVGNFEGRFLRSIDGGRDASADEMTIANHRKALDVAKKMVESINDVDSLAYKKAKADECVAGRLLVACIFRRMIDHISDHISLRIKGKTNAADEENLKQLKIDIDEDARQIHGLFEYVRRSGGRKDKDEVLAEMRGEPLMVLGTTLPGATEASLKMLYNNRYRKIAMCWKNIDDATAAIKTYIKGNAVLRNTEIGKMVDGFAAAAKSRCELMRNDPDFDAAARDLRAYRDLMRDFKLGDGHTATVTKDADDLLKRYVKLVYDISHVRTPRDYSAKKLLDDTEKTLHPGASRAKG